ncbi:c-type cytochrome [Candidatus Magnetomonas plexicatena]|uniref:c-type cytochrome n=1 Tax=Candidatus Magnetomonas plexicatena TaxID=2552947 RepID=UPI001C799460|nr:c-type cytochrome [Nitrospirales bacterium LBB_01]
MKRLKYILIAALCMFFLNIGVAASVGADDGADVKLGEKIYTHRCMPCHGKKGDGNGAVGVLRKQELSGRVLEIRPRDFTLGLYRFRTTSSGCLPTDDDLLATITNGVPRSFMTSLKDLPLEERKALRAYIKTFSSRFAEDQSCDAIKTVKPPWVGSPDSVIQGKTIYKNMKCWECHGETGKGDGTKSNDIKDDWGFPILPFNFLTGELKRGSTPEAIYMTFTSGLDGTGMPSYEDTLNEEKRWHLVSYTLKLMGKLDKKKEH